jgi:SAM-dependent methyltransferase
MSLPRRVQPELLDTLDRDDPRARRSRRDLRHIQRAMATLGVALQALDRAAVRHRPRSIVELGAGDGSLLLRIARHRSRSWPEVRVTLLDRQDLVSADALQRFRAHGWIPEVVTADVFDWLAHERGARADVVFANLFVHHFAGERLARLLAAIAARACAFVCCEPRRGRWPLLGSHLVGLLGSNAVTRHDAVASVHAGFRGREISAHWPDPSGWHLREYACAPFSHCFVALRNAVQA